MGFVVCVQKCDYQLLAPVESYGVAREHPDPVVAARFVTVARSARPRRFAFCQAIPARPGTGDGGGGVVVRPMYQGLQNPDGTCVLLLAGQPYGYYRSVDAAYHHAKGTDLYLVWLEPDHDLPDAQQSIAACETRDNPPTVWLVALPFIAHGPVDARIRAIDTANHLQPVTPGLTRRSALLFNTTDPTQPITLYCPIHPCQREPFHPGNHHPPPPEPETKTEEGTETEAEVEAGEETPTGTGEKAEDEETVEATTQPHTTQTTPEPGTETEKPTPETGTEPEPETETETETGTEPGTGAGS